MTNVHEMQKRLIAALSYDGIAENKMHIHLAKVLNVSYSVAKRMLSCKHRSILSRGIDAATALDITVNWLYFGQLDRYHHRTLRINMQQYKGYPKEITDKAMTFNLACIAGQTKAKNLLNLIETNHMNYIEAVTVF